MTAALILPPALRAAIADSACTAFPYECCGLIEGMRDGGTLRALTLHPAKNLAAVPDRFEIDPAVQVRLLRELRGTARAVIGCYHSHPDGPAEPSARDLEGAAEEGFAWLVQSVMAGKAGALGIFVYEAGVFRPLALRV